MSNKKLEKKYKLVWNSDLEILFYSEKEGSISVGGNSYVFDADTKEEIDAKILELGLIVIDPN